LSEGDRNDTLLSLLAGVGIGALVGAAAALLLAPQSGQETRTQIRGTADDLLVKLRDTVEELRGKVDEMVASLRSRGDGGGARESGVAALAGSGDQESPPAGA
jgi:gas vesicle protein